MPNLRIISDNAIDRATLSVSSTAANFSVANLQSQRKSDLWRATGTSARLTATWTALETVQAVALPFCNLSPTATMRVRLTNEASTTNYAAGSETLAAAAGWSATATLGTSALLYAGVIPYVTIAKAATATSENRNLTVGSVAANAAYTLTAAIRAGTSSQITLGLYDSAAGGTGYGPNANASAAIVSGPGSISQDVGGAFLISGLSTTQDTLVAISRTFTAAGTMSIFVYPDTRASTTVGLTNLITRLQLEPGTSYTSYYPAATAAAARPLGYIDSWQSYAYDSGNVLACPAPAVSLRGFTAAQAASAYAFGGGTYARLWMPAATQAYGLAVDVVDTNNTAGYIEASFLVAGQYWEATVNVDYGASATLVDSSKSNRNDAGDLITDAGTLSKKLSLPMSAISPTDRATLWGILRGSGIRYPLFASLFPGNADLALERDHQVYGKLVQLPAMALPRFNTASATVEIESI